MAAMTFKLRWVGAVLVVSLLGSATAERPGDHDVPPSSLETATAPAECRVIDLSMQPAKGLQIVAWIEDAAGTYIDTILITHATGSFGLGNRPGVFGMRSGPKWPYGQRSDVFPVWSHRHGMTWKQVRFQNGDGDPGGAIDCQDARCKSDSDRNLSHPFTQSSADLRYGRPLQPDEPAWDVGTVSTPAFTDKWTQ